MERTRTYRGTHRNVQESGPGHRMAERPFEEGADGIGSKFMLKQRNNGIYTTVEQNVPERNTLSLNRRKVKAERTRSFLERIGAYHENIKHAQKQVRTYRNFSGTYQNVSQNAKPKVERTRTYQNPIELLQ